jgi:hypothetical protein
LQRALQYGSYNFTEGNMAKKESGADLLRQEYYDEVFFIRDIDLDCWIF